MSKFTENWVTCYASAKVEKHKNPKIKIFLFDLNNKNWRLAKMLVKEIFIVLWPKSSYDPSNIFLETKGVNI